MSKLTDNDQSLPPEERPLECSECKKDIAVRYTLMVGDTMTRTVMCSDCPQLQQRLHGIPSVPAKEGKEIGAGLCCGNCGTTLDSVRRGIDLGCLHCYEVFGDVLMRELQSTVKVSQQMKTSKKSLPSHIGRRPGETKEMSPSIQLLALNEALSDTLQREEYEQAALLRDQIKELTEEPDGEEKS